MRLERGAVLTRYFEGRPFAIYKEVALNRVVSVSKRELPHREWDYYTRASLDFVVCSSQYPRPFELAIEVDSAFHEEPQRKVQDEIKNKICLTAGLPLIRIRSDHITKREGVPFLKYMLDLYFGEKGVRELVDQGGFSTEEEYFPGTEFDGTTALARKLLGYGVFPLGSGLGAALGDKHALYYRATTNLGDRAQKQKGESVGVAGVEVLRRRDDDLVSVLEIERRAYLKECAPNSDVPGVHGWFVAQELALFLCFQELVHKLEHNDVRLEQDV